MRHVMQFRYLHQLPALFNLPMRNDWRECDVSWHPNGRAKAIFIATDHGVHLDCSFNIDGGLCTLAARRLPAVVQQRRKGIQRSPQWSALGCASLQGSRQLALSGDLVGDAVIERLAACGVLAEAMALELIETTVGEGAAPLLAAQPRLQSIRICTAEAQGSGLAGALKMRLPRAMVRVDACQAACA